MRMSKLFDPPKTALEKACNVAGGQTDLARKIGKTQGHISQWLRRGSVPAEMVLPIELASGVSRHDLRPDLYPRDKPRAA